MKHAWLVVMLGLLHTPRVAAADPCTHTQEVIQGEVTPCAGVLTPRRKALDAINCGSVLLPTCRADLELAQARVQANAAAAVARRASCDQQVMDKHVQLERCLQLVVTAPNRPWYESPYLWGPVGVVGGALLGGTVLYIFGP